MQALLEPSKATHFVRGDKVLVVTTKLFLRGLPNKKAKGPIAWAFIRGGVGREAHLHIETSSGSTLTSYVSCEQPTTSL
jgi:hypothetical protein